MNDKPMLKRAVLTLAVLVAVIHFAGIFWDFGGLVNTISKGSSVALLALWAAMQARSFDGWLLVLIMAIGAIGDIVVDVIGIQAGGAVFAVAHVVSMLLYFRNWRANITFSQRLLAALLVPLSVFIALQLTRGHAPMLSIAAYMFLCAGMAASAWTSRFPRYRTGIGAMLFVASDLLIFAQMGPLSGASWAHPAIWSIYFAAQFLITVGVAQTLTADKGSAA